MKRTAFCPTAILIAIFVLCFSHEAFAFGPVDIEVAARVGGAPNPGETLQSNGPGPVPAPNPLGLGLGGRAGASFSGFYAGASVMYYFGGSQTVAGAGAGRESEKTLLYGLEGGYDIRVSILTLRPQIGIGNYTLSQSWTLAASNVTVSSNQNNLYVEPGVTALLSFGKLIVGADANVLFGLPGSAGAAFTADGQVGVRF
jgi:hypothetical protein